jgi:hypothetical protein
VLVLSSDLNRLVMDYLVIEGYKTAAEEFSKEASLAPPVDLDSIETRMSIREAVQRGEVEEAIAKVNDLDSDVSISHSHVFSPQGPPSRLRLLATDADSSFHMIKTFHAPLSDLYGSVMRLQTKTSVFNMMFLPPSLFHWWLYRCSDWLIDDLSQILDTNPQLFFHLQQQRLIEYIRQGDIQQALLFAQTDLAPRGEEHPEFLGELERTMALLAFDSMPNPPAAIAELLHPSQRMRTAAELNSAILKSLSQGTETKLLQLIRVLCWGETLLTEKAEFPHVDFAALAKPE